MDFQESFTEYFNTGEPNDKTNNETISGSGNYYIHHAMFSFHYQKTAISLNSSSKVLLETCTFYNNSSKNSGGSLYIKDSDCVLIHICILLSSNPSLNKGCAYCISSVEHSFNKSYAFECSVTECSGCFNSIDHHYGEIKISSMNTSYHEITWYAGYFIWLIGATGIMNFTTISNTSSQLWGGMSNLGNFTITKCNYLNNKYSESEHAIISCSHSTTYSNCSFIGNQGDYLFSYKPIIENCYINENIINLTLIFDYSGTIESISPLDSFITHYAIEGCPFLYFSNKKLDKTLKFKHEYIKNFSSLIFELKCTFFTIKS